MRRHCEFIDLRAEQKRVRVERFYLVFCLFLFCFVFFFSGGLGGVEWGGDRVDGGMDYSPLATRRVAEFNV